MTDTPSDHSRPEEIPDNTQADTPESAPESNPEVDTDADTDIIKPNKRSFLEERFARDSVMIQTGSFSMQADTLFSGRNHQPEKKISEKDDIQVGMLFGGCYKTVAKGGHGKLGQVWQAFDIIGERTVALKFVPRNLQRFDQEMQRVREMFSMVHALSHQYICPLYALVNDDTFGYFLVMRWMPETLIEFCFDHVDENNRLPHDLAMRIISNLAEGLDYAHAQGVIHRDVKPANIAVERDADGNFLNACLIDFGLSALIKKAVFRGNSRTQKVVQISGTPCYMPPEQWASETQDAKSDQYSLAVVAYELLCGQRPFANHNMEVLRASILNDKPDRISGVPNYVNDALFRAMSKKRQDRFDSCVEFYQALSGAKHQQHLKIGLAALSLVLFSLLLAGLFFIFKPIISIDNTYTVVSDDSFEHADQQVSKQMGPVLSPDELAKLAESWVTSPPERSAAADWAELVPDGLSINGEKLADPQQAAEGAGWRYRWDQESATGVVTLDGYSGGPISAGGVNLALETASGSKNEIVAADGNGVAVADASLTIHLDDASLSVRAQNADAVHCSSDFTLQGGKSGTFSLEGGLFHGGIFRLLNAEADGAPVVVPPFEWILDGHSIDRAVRTFEELSESFYVSGGGTDMTVLVANNIETDYYKHMDVGRISRLIIPKKCRFTLLSSGDWTIRRGPNSNDQEPLLYVRGELTLGQSDSKTSASLALDGGADWQPVPAAVAADQTTDTAADAATNTATNTAADEAADTAADTPAVSLRWDCPIGTNEGRLNDFLIAPSRQHSLYALVAVTGKLNIHRNISIQNNDNRRSLESTEELNTDFGLVAGGVIVERQGELNMDAGQIVHCAAAIGAGVSVLGKFQLSGGRIFENVALNRTGHFPPEGAGVRVMNGSFFMTGGEISDNIGGARESNATNTVAAKGAGIHVSTSATAVLSGGQIVRNASLWAGGGIYAGGNGTSQMTIDGVLIAENIAEVGGGVYMNSPVILRTGQVIHNAAVDSNLVKTGAFPLERNDIYLNKADLSGMAVLQIEKYAAAETPLYAYVDYVYATSGKEPTTLRPPFVVTGPLDTASAPICTGIGTIRYINMNIGERMSPKIKKIPVKVVTFEYLTSSDADKNDSRQKLFQLDVAGNESAQHYTLQPYSERASYGGPSGEQSFLVIKSGKK